MPTRWTSLAAILLAMLLVCTPARGADETVIDRWLLAGPFKGDPAKLLEAPPIGDLKALAPAAGQAAGEAKWVEHATATGVVDFADPRVPVTSTSNCVVAGFAYVYSPRMQPAKLLMGFTPGMSVWLNGRRVFDMPDGGTLTPNAYRAEALLGEGWNRLLVLNARYTAFRWTHGFAVRLTDPDLRPVAGAKFATASPFPDGKVVEPVYAPYVAAHTVEHFGTHRIRLVNHSPVDLKDVTLTVRSPAGRELMNVKLGDLPGLAHTETDIDVDEIFYKQHFPGAVAVVTFAGGRLESPLTPLTLEGAHSIEYETPHINRMRPWAAGRPVILLLTRGRGRQAVELLQRGDFEWHWVDTAEKDADKAIVEELKLYKFDGIVVAAQDWTKLAPHRMLEKTIADGAGVVYVNPSGLSKAMAAVLRLDADAPRDKEARSARVDYHVGHPVLSGVPVKHLPPIGPYGYKVVERVGDTASMASVDGRGVVIVNERAPGRAVTLNLGRGAELIWPIAGGRFLDTPLPEWERQWSLLLKAIVWAARKDAGLGTYVQVPEKVSRDAPAHLQVLLRPAAEKATDVKVDVVFRSRGLDGPRSVLATKIPARNDSPVAPLQMHGVSVPIPASLAGGENEADVTVRDAEGKVLDWASGVFTIEPRGSLGAIDVAPAKDYYLPSEEVTFTAAGKAGTDGLALTGELADNRGRVVWRQVRPVKAGDFRQTYTLTPAGLVTPVARFRATLAAPGHVEAEAETVLFVRRPFVWDSYEPVLWLTRNGTNWYYDVEYFRMLRNRMWIPNGWSSSYGPRGDAWYQMVYGGFDRVGWESLHFFSMNHNWTNATFELRRGNFNKTGDVRWLYRTPIDRATGKPIDTPDYSNLRYGNDPHNSFFPLDDPGYHEWTRKKIADQVQRVARFDPIIYDLMDEGSYTSYARAFDFDFSPGSLKHFRAWLKEQYGTLAALNKEWETDFAAWDDVKPMHTNEVRQRARGKALPNYAPWVDHRRYNDIVYNRYIKLTSDAARTGGDPDACVGIGGGQRANPYGGWDYWLVANHFTWLENYFEDTDEYLRSFNPPGRPLRACSGKDVWKNLSHGGMGFYRWVDYGHIRPDFSLLPRGETTARQLEEVRGGGLAKLVLAAAPADDPIGIHYSQPTVQLSYIRGGTGAADQLGNGGPLNAKLGFYNLLEEMGYQYKFVAYAQLEAGHLQQAGCKLMILPESQAISDAEAARLKQFVEAGGVLLCDRITGEWDNHGRKRPQSVLAEQFGIDPGAAADKQVGKGWVIYLNEPFPVAYWRDRNVADVSKYWAQMTAILAKAGLGKPRAHIQAAGKPARRTEIRYFTLGGIRYHVVRAEIPGPYTFVTDTPGTLYDMRTGASGTGSLAIEADPEMPALVALSPYRIDAVTASGPGGAVKRGGSVSVSAAVKASAAAGEHMLNFRVYDPSGQERRWYSQTLSAPGGAATLTFTTALNDPKGTWFVRVTDLASQRNVIAMFAVE